MDEAARITLILPDFGGGGAERVMVSLANMFASRGVHTTVVVGRSQGPYRDDLDEAVELRDLSVSRLATALPALIRHFDRDKPHTVLSALTHANLLTLLAARMSRKKPRTVIAEHNSVMMLLRGNRWPKKMVKRALIRSLYPTADDIVLVSRDMQKEFASYLSLPPERFESIPNPILAHQSDDLRSEPTHEWLREKSLPVVVGAGRLSEQKDFGTLLRAFASLRKRVPARLIVFGEGPRRRQLERLRAELGLEDSVDFPGFVQNLKAELRASDLFVLSSRWEGLPLVLLEALASGARVVATDCPTGPNEVLQGGKWGRLVPVGDVTRMADAMRRALEDPPVADSSEALEPFDPETIADRYLSILLPDAPQYRKAVA